MCIDCDTLTSYITLQDIHRTQSCINASDNRFWRKFCQTGETNRTDEVYIGRMPGSMSRGKTTVKWTDGEGLVRHHLCRKRCRDFGGSETEHDSTWPCCYEKVNIMLGCIKRITSKNSVIFLLGTKKVLSWSNRVQFWTLHLENVER